MTSLWWRPLQTHYRPNWQNNWIKIHENCCWHKPRITELLHILSRSIYFIFCLFRFDFCFMEKIMSQFIVWKVKTTIAIIWHLVNCNLASPPPTTAADLSIEIVSLSLLVRRWHFEMILIEKLNSVLFSIHLICISELKSFIRHGNKLKQLESNLLFVFSFSLFWLSHKVNGVFNSLIYSKSRWHIIYLLINGGSPSNLLWLGLIDSKFNKCSTWVFNLFSS